MAPEQVKGMSQGGALRGGAGDRAWQVGRDWLQGRLMSESFASFMARALHDPQRGYYARRVQDIGTRGDFATSATLSPLLGKAIALWLREERAMRPEIRHVIEIGAGNGMLMQTVKQQLGWWQRRRFQWHIVETSASLREQQQQRLGTSVSWQNDLKKALEACGGRAFLYHNELLDAFPVRLCEWHEETWQEVMVEITGAGVRESLRELVLPETTTFSALSVTPKQKRQRVELHESVRDWLHYWAPTWESGAMLTVDYGDTFPALYHRRPHGTLRAYLMHQRLEGAALYENIGRQDITADINFTDYRAWAQALGWQEWAYGTQADFILKRLPKADDRLLEPDGAGTAFKHVIHRCG